MLMLLALQTRPASQGASDARARRQEQEFDSTTAIVAAVGARVAEVKSGLDGYRRAVFNLPDAEVVSSAEALRARCHALDSAAVSGARRVCRACGSREFRVALVGYRDMLPTLGRVAGQCAARLSRLSRQKEPARPLRQEVRVVGNAIVQGLVPYERRLEVLREAAGWAPPRPRRGAGRPRGP